MKNKKILGISLGIVSVFVIGIVIAYAALSATLNAKFNSVTQSALTWDIGFTGSTVEGTAGGTSSTGRSCGLATVTKSGVTIDSTTLSKPGDSCSYTFTIKNDGSLDGKVSEITAIKPDGVTCTTPKTGTMVCGNITYEMTYVDIDTPIAPNGYVDPVLKVSYTGTDLSTTTSTQAGGGFNITFTQA